MYNLLILTHLPAFYKINLYNEIAKQRSIFVVFIATGSIERTPDFVQGDIQFPHAFLNTGDFEKRPLLRSLWRLALLLRGKLFHTVLVGGWDLPEFWILTLFCLRARRALTLESTIHECRTKGLRGWSKRFFLTRIHLVFASGNLHAALARKLGFRGQMILTRGVGLMAAPRTVEQSARVYRKRFLFLGRLSPEKNLTWLLQVFANLPELHLSLAGKGPQSESLRQQATQNVTFLGHIPNDQLDSLFAAHDFLLLVSLREPWGLVVEEALARGVPVIVSERCGASELITHAINGYVTPHGDAQVLTRILQQITEASYQELQQSFAEKSLESQRQRQVLAYYV